MNRPTAGRRIHTTSTVPGAEVAPPPEGHLAASAPSTSLQLTSPVNLADVAVCAAVGAAVLLSDGRLLFVAGHDVVGEPLLLASMVMLAVQGCLAVAGYRAVRRTRLVGGDTARARIQAQAFRAASCAALGAAFLLASVGGGSTPGVVGGAGVVLLLVAGVIFVGALTPRAVRGRLEGEADRRIAAAR